MNVVNRELRELRIIKEHYKRVLDMDKQIKESGDVEGCLLLSDEDIVKINTKIDLISVEIEKLLDLDDQGLCC